MNPFNEQISKKIETQIKHKDVIERHAISADNNECMPRKLLVAFSRDA